MKKFRFTFIFVLLLSLFVCLDDSKAEAAIVNTNQVYSYEKMEQDIVKLAKAYPDLITYKVIGKSEYGRNIYAVSLGKGESSIFINGSHHAREWLTTSLNMNMIEQYAASYKSGSKIDGYNVKNTLNNTTIWFVPMVNPDGVTLQQFGLSKFPSSDHGALIKMNGGSRDFKRWKANGKGVDLNRQYNANWANIKSNVSKPNWKNHKGTKPESAAETKALINFVNTINPYASVSYHSSGEILFWNFRQTGSWYNRDHAYAKNIGKMTGYRLIYPGPNPSGGGFTDWFIINFKRPAFTPEISRYYGETNPPVSEFSRVWNQNKAVGLYVASIGHSLYVNDEAGRVKDAEKKVNTAVDKANNLRFYYSGRIQNEKDIVVDSGFNNAYQTATVAIKTAENSLTSLEKKDQDALKEKLQPAYDHKNKAATFIDGLTTTNKLADQAKALQTVVNNGKLDGATVTAYHELSEQIRKSGLMIGKMYNPTVRELTQSKFVIPSMILKETIIYEISRYMLIEEIETMLSARKYRCDRFRISKTSKIRKTFR